ncbi:MAG: hypothetical protein J6N45_08335 [Alphaproteobacteria bacterium]|nr:hypothetical protein [Alphaproteobacteria bacterium]
MVDETTDKNINETGSDTGQHTPAPRYVEKNGERLEIPDNFWDKENDKPDVYSILKSQNDLRTQIGEDKSPADGIYKINIPEEFQDRLEANPEDPLYKKFSAFAKKNRMSQEDFDNITKEFYKGLYDLVEPAEDNTNNFDEEAYLKNEADKLKEKYGDKVDQIRSHIDNFVRNSGITDKDILNEIAYMQTSASGVATLDYLLGLRSDPMPAIAGTTAPEGVMNLNELRKLQAEPGYQNGTDQELIRKVTEGYKKLFPE